MFHALVISGVIGVASWVTIGTIIWCLGDLSPEAHAFSGVAAFWPAAMITIGTFLKTYAFLSRRLNSIRYVRRLYGYDADVIALVVQRTLAGAHYGPYQWQVRSAELEIGYFNFVLSAQESWGERGSLSNLLVLEVYVDYDAETDMTKVDAIFGGNAFSSLMEGLRFQNHAQQIVKRFDQELPDHTKLEISKDEIVRMQLKAAH